MISVNINLLFNIINILVLCVLIRIFLFKPVKKIMAERQEIIDRRLADAETAKAQALALENQHKQLMQGIEDEKLAVLAGAQKRAAEEYELLVADAKLRSAGIIKKAEAEAVSRKDEILKQAKDEITDIIVAATARVSGVGGGNDNMLYDEFLKKAGVTDGSDSEP